jgi:hypothetical protein
LKGAFWRSFLAERALRPFLFRPALGYLLGSGVRARTPGRSFALSLTANSTTQRA